MQSARIYLGGENILVNGEYLEINTLGTPTGLVAALLAGERAPWTFEGFSWRLPIVADLTGVSRLLSPVRRDEE